ncbi:MAG: HlyD family efflux transporter periplasmic adaptor subunit, partial [Pseudobutyrivibrio sp.]|nr:HlyD family efflux transporter periplasmic adaptor subunit [Pseudobutyrivibrio sp.]
QVSATRDKDNSSSTLNDKKSAEDNAKTALDTANDQVNKAKAALDDAKTKVDSTLLSDLNNKVDELTKQKNDKLSEDAAADVSDINEQIEGIKSEISSLQDSVSSAQKAYDEAVSNANSKRSEYDSAVSDRKSAEGSLQSANDALTKANNNVSSAASNVGNVQNSANEEIINQAQAIKNNDLSTQSNTLSSKQEIAKSKEELSKAVVYASQDGTVTNVNVVAGKTYAGTDAVVIDNVTSLKATADIDEAQIPSIAVGQKVTIKTDATGDEILNGTVSFVSPTATKNSSKTTEDESTTSSVSKSRATYRVDVTIADANPNLRLGMTAKMTFITADVKDAIVVPTADLQTDGEGNKYVTLQNSDGTTKNLTVVTGISDDFYTEIKENSLKEGETIVEATTDGSADSVLSDMGADGGIYFE